MVFKNTCLNIFFDNRVIYATFQTPFIARYILTQTTLRLSTPYPVDRKG